MQEIKGRVLRDQLGERLIEESGANFEAPSRQAVLQQAGAASRAARGASGAAEIVRDGDRRAASARAG